MKMFLITIFFISAPVAFMAYDPASWYGVLFGYTLGIGVGMIAMGAKF